MTAADVLGQVALLLSTALVGYGLTTGVSRRSRVLTAATVLLVLCAGLATLGSVLPVRPDVLLPVAVAGAALAAATASRWVAPHLAGPALALGLLMVIGYLTQMRLGAGRDTGDYGRWAVIGIVVFVVALLAGRWLPWTPGGELLQWAGVGLLLLPLLPGLGLTINGARAWIGVGSFTVQPGEFARPLLVAGLALSLDQYAPLLRHGAVRSTVPAVLPIGLAVGLLAVVHHDLGPTLVLGTTALALFLLLRPPRKFVLVMLAVPPVAATVAYLAVPRLHQRVDHWLHPVTAGGALENTGAALDALARGGWTGTGLGRGTPASVANVDNDFALVAVAEERGLVGVACYVLVIALVCRHLLASATDMHDDRRRLLVLAPAVMLSVQAGYVVLATAGVAPVTGMVVPFLSSGGSALIATSATVGALLGVHASAAGAAPRSVNELRFRSGVAAVRRLSTAVWLVAVIGFVVVMSGPATSAQAGGGPRGRLLSRDGLVLAETVAGARTYPLGALTGHVVGHGSTSGIEAAAQAGLSCEPGWFQSLTGAGCTPPDVVTGLDEQTQRAASDALNGRTGSVIVLDLRDFSVLADYSSPAVDPARLPDSYDRRLTALRDPATAVASAPGSTFKLVTAAAMLERGLPTETPQRAGFKGPGMTVGVRNAGGMTCGGSLTDALAISCNTSFAEYALTLGADRLRQTAAAFGYLGESTVGKPRDASELARTGLGLQDVRATPLQQALVAASVATGGVQRPVRTIIGSCRDGTYRPDAPLDGRRVLSAGTAGQLAAGMTGAVRWGTAQRLHQLPFAVAAKTGTADAADGRTDAWLIGYAPADAPTVAVAVRVPGDDDHEQAGGASDAAPVAAAVLATAVPATAVAPDAPCN